MPGGPLYQAGAGCGPTHATITALVEDATMVEADWTIIWPTDNQVYGAGTVPMTQVADDRWEVTLGDFVVEPPSTVIDVYLRAANDWFHDVYWLLSPPMTLNDHTFCS